MDEAYIEFTEHPSALSLLPRYGNVLVLRTLSKAFALAGAHVGFALGHSEVIEAMAKIINPYPIAVYDRLRQRRIFIRPLPALFGQGGWLRFTIGSDEEMAQVLQGMN